MARPSTCPCRVCAGITPPNLSCSRFLLKLFPAGTHFPQANLWFLVQEVITDWCRSLTRSPATLHCGDSKVVSSLWMDELESNRMMLWPRQGNDKSLKNQHRFFA